MFSIHIRQIIIWLVICTKALGKSYSDFDSNSVCFMLDEDIFEYVSYKQNGYSSLVGISLEFQEDH